MRIEYEKYEALIQQQATKINESTGVDVDEIMSLSRTVWMEIIDKWDSSRGRFSTFLMKSLRSKVEKHRIKNPKTLDYETQLNNLHAPQVSNSAGLEFAEWKEQLTTDARHLVTLLLDSPCEAFGVLGGHTPKFIRGLIIRAFMSPPKGKKMLLLRQKKEAWTRRKVHIVFKEIRTALHTI